MAWTNTSPRSCNGTPGASPSDRVGQRIAHTQTVSERPHNMQPDMAQLVYAVG